ncbi:xanthine dehydrogenase family protein molybdopterin-binding subunit [Actinocatenispora rupis]|uniref:Carbon-monoxide dehydrogenase large subunit n=1 Tax=Actinocatenispora rupis TaxID=519421 RepID=A0A8J3NGR3_9ACTN|nr:xanthine dehydrogenase family protein molybdopterin-binding subunit [Actinocatenispora rupis]GID16265.1 carbon-monoxide dehydrogenase large subunit [Actinocatenispora rupis]
MTATQDTGTREVGTARRRKEDAHLITGQTTWTDNIQLAGTVHAALLRSPMAHARIRVDVSAARNEPGVVAAYSGADLADELAGLPSAWQVTPDWVAPEHKPLATDEVRYAGDAVAVVVADTRAHAVDALDAIEVDYEPLPVVLDMERAMADDSPLVHSDAGTNVCFRYSDTFGDVAGAFADAPLHITRRYVQQRLVPCAMEPRSVVVAPVPAAGEYTVWSSTQIPHFVRLFLALLTGVSESRIRVIAPDVGGGFGSKLDIYAEELLTFTLARKLGRPVKWTETRSEAFQATIHGRDQIQDLDLACDADGRIRGLRVNLLADMGAYLQLLTPAIPLLGRAMFPGIYKMDAYEFGCVGVFTDKTPTDAYRGAGRPEATFAIERLLDELAAELHVDPLEIRRRNWIRHEEFPYDQIAGLTYDSGNYEAATARATELFDYAGLRAEQARRREAHDPVQLGIGVSTYTEMCGLAPSRWLGDRGYAGGGWEAASVRLLPTGKVEAVVGTSPHGQGHVTTFSQIVADTLGVPFDDVEVVHGDTAAAPAGLDTYGSRSLAVGGVAVWRAAQRVRDKAKTLAAHLLEVSEDDLDFDGGSFAVRGTPGATKTIQEVAFAAFAAHSIPEGFEPTLSADFVLEPDDFSFPHGTHLCAVDVDTETGRVTIRRYVAVDDVGKVVNPLIVEGQVHGGLAQGIAQALHEIAVYDEDGNLTTGTMVDYTPPSAADLPSFTTDRTETPSTTNPLGVKGVGEAGTIASTPAVVNAVVDALRPYGVTDVPMPCTPERVWRAIHEAQGGTS